MLQDSYPEAVISSLPRQLLHIKACIYMGLPLLWWLKA
uniref:Uncharacterized protein n=1 Tax=Klebsiella pneumoniae TaxID=573 RepID=A0A6H0AAD9_KLEPN|nr:hypothetical protein [Klebsiella pneumoniae]